MRRTVEAAIASGYVTDDEMERFALRMGEVLVVRFHDDREDLRWFRRQVEELGTLRVVTTDNDRPLDVAGAELAAREMYGDGCRLVF